MSAGNFIERLLEYDVGHRYEILVFGQELHVAYNRVSLSSYFETGDPCVLYMKQLDWLNAFSEARLQYYTDTIVTNIDYKHKLVSTTDEIHSYDILLLATGSVPFIPPSINANIQGVFVFRTIQNVESMISYSRALQSHKGAKCAVVVGGGLLGLEAAKAFLNLGIFDKVVVLERSPHILARQIDSEAARIVSSKIESFGISIKVNATVDRLDVINGRLNGVFLQKNGYLECQMLCFAIGVRARDGLARESGLKCHAQGGIVVDQNLQTNVKDVYAIGDCANFKNRCYGLYSPGFEMGDILAYNLVNGRKKEFSEPALSTKLKFFGVKVASFGDLRESKNVRAMVYKDPFGKIYRKLFFSSEKRLLGGILVGDIRDSQNLIQLVKSQSVISQPDLLLKSVHAVCKHFNLSELVAFLVKQSSSSRNSKAWKTGYKDCSCSHLIEKISVSVNQINAKL
ncbi:hypothetical protein HK103_000803 [Boothiomyces macroporosus]|uniref:Uncharacterized protein n=1 Tax=Boothiomyces macroporosus TaxID=261099 RepID=A0AAD5UEW2_9FUNG|nr:hypothetical protein HK103_000803 [Boothiomyces macroporosus]